MIRVGLTMVAAGLLSLALGRWFRPTDPNSIPNWLAILAVGGGLLFLFGAFLAALGGIWGLL